MTVAVTSSRLSAVPSPPALPLDKSSTSMKSCRPLSIGASLLSIRNPKVAGDNRWQAIFPTVLYCVTALGIGVSHGLPNPRAETDASTTAAFIFVRLFAFFVGTVIGGFVMDKLPRQLFILFFLSIATLCVSLLPFARSLMSSLILGSGFGCALAILELGSIVFILDLWGEFAAPFLHMFAFFLALGAYLIPAAVGPLFLATAPSLTLHNAILPSAYDHPFHSPSLVFIHTMNDAFPHDVHGKVPSLHEPHVPDKFHISNLTEIRKRSTHLWRVFLERAFAPVPFQSHELLPFPFHSHHRRSLAPGVKRSHAVDKPLSFHLRQQGIRMVYLFVSAFFLATTLQALLTLALFPWDIQSQQESSSKDNAERPIMEGFFLVGAYFFLLGTNAGQSIVALRCPSPLAFWGVFVAARFIALPLSIWFRTRTLLLVSYTLSISGLVLFLVTEMSVESTTLRVLAALPAAIGSAPLVPGTIAWTEEHLSLNNRRAAFLLVATFVGEALLPLSASVPAPFFIHAPLYNLIGFAALSILGLASLLSISRAIGPKTRTTPLPDYMLAESSSSEDEDEEDEESDSEDSLEDEANEEKRILKL